MSRPSAPPTYDESVENKDYNPGIPLNSPPYPTAQPPHPQPSAPVGYGTSYQPVSVQPYESTPEVGVGYQPNPSSGPYVEDGFTTRSGFDDQNVRRLFIRKVYITLGLQLIVTFGIVCIFTFVTPVKEFIKHNQALYYVAYGIFLVLYICLICCTNIRRKHPTNIILLGIFTLAFSYMVGTIASFYNTLSVVIALGITVGVCIAVTLFSMQTKFDFTKCSGLLFVLVLVLMLFGFITIFTYRYTWYLQIVYGALGALVFTLFLAFDTQLIMGGKRYELDPEEYIYGALNLYVDVVYIFIYILMLFGGDH